MKTILIFLFGILLSFNVLSSEFSNQKEYNIKKKSICNVPNVIEFFSFFCPYCYEFEKTHNMRTLIKKNFNKNIKIHTYHVNLIKGKLSYILTKSWIIAEQMGIEEKIMIPVFSGVQETHTINTINSIRQLFKKKAGIKESIFDNFWNSITIDILVQKQNQDIKKCKLEHVPTMLINGKYIINYSNIEDIFKDNFPQKYIKLIKFLIKKK